MKTMITLSIEDIEKIVIKRIAKDRNLSERDLSLEWYGVPEYKGATLITDDNPTEKVSWLEEERG